MRSSLLVLALFAPLSVWAQYTHPHLPDPPVTQYTIDVTLNAEQKSLDASQTLVYTNHSEDTIPDLHFHLYLNAFKNEATTFWRESGGTLRSDEASDEGWGYIDLKTLAIDGSDRLDAVEFIRPDDGNPYDETVIRVPLETPIEPGGSITITCDFFAQLPEVFARTGYKNNYMLVGQWFPKLGVWETAGQRGREAPGWNCHQFHATSEFYADYGRYEVSIDVPSEYVIGATGKETQQEARGDRTRYTFVQDNVIDFAWTASPRFIREVRTFDASDRVAQAEYEAVMALHDIPYEEAELSDVEMILLLQPENKRMRERYFKSLANAIKFFGLWYGPYPHETITLVDPAYGAGGSAGMEYPTFITGGTDLFAPQDAYGYLPAMGGPEEVTVHEFGHQYWQGMIGSNEFEEPWLDEGFNSYSTGLIMDRRYLEHGLYHDILGIPINTGWLIGAAPAQHTDQAHVGFLYNDGADAIVRSAWGFRNISSYFLNSYPKTEAALHLLRNKVGDDTMARIMRAYFARWQFKHPSTDDFIAAAEEVSGQELDEFFDRVVFTPGWTNYYVSSVDHFAPDDAKGVFDIDGERKTRGEEEESEDEDESSDDDTPVDARVVIVREGNIPYPIEIEIRFADGTTTREQWDGEYSWTAFTYENGPKVERVIIDPDSKMTIESVFNDNDYILESESEAYTKWKSPMLALIAAQHALLSILAGAF